MDINVKVKIKRVFDDAASEKKALASVLLNDAFIIHNVTLIKKRNKTFVSMPSYKKANGKWQNNCHPTKSDTRQEIEAAYIEAYNKFLAERAA